MQAFNTPKNDIIPVATIGDCFTSLLDDECDYAVVPFENSTNGSVMFTFDYLRDLYHGKQKQQQQHHVEEEENGKKKRRKLEGGYGSFTQRKIGIVAEEFVSINHCLITEAKELKDITKVYSHPQVWGQCNKWYSEHLKGIEQIDTNSTSKAVELVKGDSSCAAIASAAAAQVHNVPILQPSISNNSTNCTRFLIFSKQRPEKLYKGEEYNTLLSFTVEHEQPGALCNALQLFAKQNLNLTSIASRPRANGEDPWTYVYFIELHGHETDPALKTALQEMYQYCLQIRIMGSFKRNRIN